MIQFKCPKCQMVIKAGDDQAGTVVACRGCKAKLRVPASKSPPAPVKKKPADEIEEVAPVEDEEDEAPRKKKPARARDREDDEADDEDEDRPRKGKRRKGDKTPSGGGSLVSGIVYILLGVAIAAVGLIAPTMLELQVNPLVPRIFGPVAGLLVAGLGIFYIVRK